MADENPAPKSPDRNNERDRRSANIFLLLAAIGVIVAGIWLVDALLAARKADQCLSSGRRNC